MGGIGGLLGTAGGAAGTGFAGPQSANISNPTNPDQISTAYNSAQQGLTQQQNLLNALQAQNGLANQTNVYNQLQGIAAGTGPNPAKAQLAQATGQNIAAQGALMAGQRGANANVGLMARNIAQQGANTQQQAVGQGSTLQAQQSLNALNNLQNLATTQAGQQIGQTNALSQARQAEQQNLLNAQQAYNNAQVGMQSNINNVSGQLANTQMQGQQALLGGIMNAGGALASLAEGGEVDQPEYGNFQGASTPETANTSTPAFGSDAGASSLGGGKSGGSGGGGLMGMLALLYSGGEVRKAYADGTTNATAGTAQPDPNQPMSKFGQFIKKATQGPSKNPGEATPNYGNAGANALYQGVSNLGKDIGQAMKSKPDASTPVDMPMGGEPTTDTSVMAAEGGKVPALVSPGEVYLSPDKVKEVKKGKDPIKTGEKIPGKPKFPGNDYRNDTVKKTLTEGGIVIPNEVLQKPNAHWHAMKFVHATMAKNKHGKKK